MAVTENVERVYPTKSELEQESQTNVQCPIAGCLKIFQQPSALRFHLVRLHKLILSESDARLAQLLKPRTKKRYEYYCPESGCRFSGHEQKFFQSYKKLKQHYMRLHAQRTLVCSVCDERFGLGYDLTRHVNRCHQKPWCLSCKTCMGSLESLSQHLSETGHTGMTDQRSEDTCHAEISDHHSEETCHTRLSKEGLNTDSQASNASQMLVLKEAGSKTETEITEYDEKIKPVDASDQISTYVNISTTKEAKQIVNSDVPIHLLSSSADRNPDAADKRSHEKIVLKPKDGGSFSRKKKSNSGQNATPRTILPAPNFVVISSGVGAVLFYGVPVQESESKLKRLAPRPSSSLMERDTSGIGGILPVTDGDKRDMWTTCSARDLKSLETVRESVSTQTRHRKIRFAETQTTEGHLLKICNSPLSTQTCGSQVSPRARVKRLNRDVQSIHTQTSRILARRQKSNISDQITQKTLAIPSMPASNDWPDFAHNETQTMALLQQLQASLAESSSTQTLESYLFDNLPNENCIAASSSETCANPCSTITMLQDSVYTTISTEGSDLFNSVMLPLAEEQATKNTNAESISNTNRSEYSLFSSEFLRAVEGDQNRSSTQCDGFLIHDHMFAKDELNSSGETRCDEDLLTERKTFTAETQTMHSDSLTDFLTAASQTNNFDDALSMNMETQTADDYDLFTQFWTHMETQTTEEFLTEFGFSDIETQTTWMFGEDVLPHDVVAGNPSLVPQRSTVLSDMQTQTCFQ